MDVSLKSLVSFEVEKEGRRYIFTMPANSPAGECYDALYEFLAKVVKISHDNLKAVERQQPEVKTEG